MGSSYDSKADNQLAGAFTILLQIVSYSKLITNIEDVIAVNLRYENYAESINVVVNTDLDNEFKPDISLVLSCRMIQSHQNNT